jgi:hypothetical protein
MRCTQAQAWHACVLAGPPNSMNTMLDRVRQDVRSGIALQTFHVRRINDVTAGRNAFFAPSFSLLHPFSLPSVLFCCGVE